MAFLKKHHMPLFAAAFMGFSSLAQPGEARFYYSAPQQASQLSNKIGLSTGGTGYTGNMFSGTQSIQWNSNSIDLSQLQSLFGQFPGANQLNIQFPNQTNWAVSPSQLQNLVGNYQQEAQSVGVSNSKMPSLSFSSLAADALSGGSQLSIASIKSGDFKTQMDNLLRDVRYQEMNMSNGLPEWLKRVLLAITDAMYFAIDFMNSKLQAMFR